MAEELPLSLLYERSLRFCETADTSTTPDGDIEEAVGWLQQCERLVTALGLFSPNEEVEDIATGDLKYLLVSFHLAELQARLRAQEVSARKLLLEEAILTLERFLIRCNQYHLIPAAAKIEESTDPTTRREQKIERFRREKAAKATLATVQQNILRSKRLSQLSSESTVSEAEEEGEREAWLTRIELAILRAAEQSQILKQEVEMLGHAEKLPDHERKQPLQPPPADLLKQLRMAASNLELRKDQIRAKTFRPGHNLPTRTLRQQAEIEIDQARAAERAQQRAKQKQQELEADEDFQLQKQRAWDDWRDENPRGEGNSRLRPTA